jgi:suppressor for copper-sensitivity B
LVIALSLIGVKLAGHAVGWGIQFQHPWFLGLMAALTALFAANLFGLYEISMPSWAGGFGRKGGSFATGAFATLLATPCSAPFLGTAVGFALGGSASDILLVFVALGLGMAAPYLALAAVPGVHRFLPKPGAWMVRLRQVLGVALAATAVWLLIVLGAQLTATAPMTDSPRIAKTNAIAWEPFDPNAIPLLVAQGKTVFVDITADWCLTCQVNKQTVLYRGNVRELLQKPDVVAMQGDWTRPNAAIAEYLRSFGRYAIPFDAVYGPLTPDGAPLSELLSSDEVTAALANANR